MKCALESQQSYFLHFLLFQSVSLPDRVKKANSGCVYGDVFISYHRK